MARKKVRRYLEIEVPFSAEGFPQRRHARASHEWCDADHLITTATDYPSDALKILRLVAFVLLAVSASMVRAQEDKKTDDERPADPDTGESTVEESTLGLLPNPLQKYGIKFAATYIGETLGNVSGGLKQGAIYEGQLNLAVDVDLQKLIGLRELTFHANLFQIYGDELSRSNLRNFLVASGIEALPSTRLYEAWFEQKWGDKLSLRTGQLAADTEFINAKYTDVFTNASLGWPSITSVNLPSGGPSPPLAALGARLRANLTDNWTLATAIFDGDAAGPGPDDPQLRDNHGVNFRMNDPPLVIGEVQYIWHGKKGDPGLDGKFKIGGWRHFGQFSDQRFTAQGTSLANPLGSGIPANLTGNSGVYSVFEQKIYRVGKDDERGIGIFARVASSPPDRNLIDLYADGGVEFIGLSDIRPKDKLGVGAGYAHLSSRAHGLDIDFAELMGPNWPQRRFESLATAVYQYEVRPGWILQPSLEYFVHPGGGATAPPGPNPGKLLRDAAVFGLRTVLTF
jgi:porin